MATESAKKLIEKKDIVGLADWISGDDVDDAIDALRADLLSLSLNGLESGPRGPAAKLLVFGVASGDDGMKQVADRLEGVLQGLASADDEDAQGFCAALLSKLVRRGFAEKVLNHPNALTTVVRVLENQKSDVDVDSACIGVLSSICESNVVGATQKVDNALGPQTFSTLLSRPESECVNGAFLLMSHVATLPNTRNNLLGDNKLMQLIFKSFASNELVGHAANAFLSLAIDDRAVQFAAQNPSEVEQLVKAISEDNFLSTSERAKIGFLLVLLSRGVQLSESQQTAVWKLTQSRDIDERDFADIKISADQAVFVVKAPQNLQAFTFWLLSKLTLPADHKASIHAAVKSALDSALSSSNGNLKSSAEAAQKKLA
eukprot:TRINITY_DN7012_c0_g1_i1.p1 TRINITY_DN7012_c0_g1~~TRINITY_DN7012_c0_g1_i1.p1  ORF type:complete len:385 (+),score=97.81 TRINITY_DN7012_c0_g1_i1:34-1155(+)